MATKTVSCTFDREAVWRKVRDRKAIFLDTNAWINMADDKSELATRVKGTLRKLVADGIIICPLSFGLIIELYKQGEDSRLRTGTLMEELSLNVSYAIRKEVFAWEVERAVRRLAGVGPIDLSTHGLYVPILAYLTSQFSLTFGEEWPEEHIKHFTTMAKKRMESLTLTEILKMRAGRNGDRIFDFVKRIPAPKYSEAARQTWDMVKGDKQKIQRIESESIFKQYIHPALGKLTLAVRFQFMSYLKAAQKDKYGGFLGELINHLPAIHNHMELMAAITQQPSRKDKINDFFDNEIMPVPLAYASAFVSQDKGIRDLLTNRTDILKCNSCRYCSDLGELEEWLKAESLA